MDVLVREIAATAKAHGGPPKPNLRTVYFGGGTPSLAPPSAIRRVVTALRDGFGLADACEVNLELDPGTALADASALGALTAPLRDGGAGVTRFSVGVQTLDDALLKECGRAHDAREAHEALRLLEGLRDRVASLRFSVDVMTGLPHQTLRHVDETIDAVLRYAPDHVSLYDLQVEERTKFGRMYTPGVAPLPAEADAAAMLAHASSKFKMAGLERYEVSSYSRGRHARSRHNEVYWSGAPYLAFGVGASSYLHRRRFARPSKIAAYEKFVARLEAGADDVPWELTRPHAQGDAPSDDELAELALDTVMLRLRTCDGLDMRTFADAYGRKAARTVMRALLPHVRAGNAEIHRRPGLVVSLTDPGGFLVANDVISDVFLALDED